MAAGYSPYRLSPGRYPPRRRDGLAQRSKPLAYLAGRHLNRLSLALCVPGLHPLRHDAAPMSIVLGRHQPPDQFPQVEGQDGLLSMQRDPGAVLGAA